MLDLMELNSFLSLIFIYWTAALWQGPMILDLFFHSSIRNTDF